MGVFRDVKKEGMSSEWMEMYERQYGLTYKKTYNRSNQSKQNIKENLEVPHPEKNLTVVKTKTNKQNPQSNS